MQLHLSLPFLLLAAVLPSQTPPCASLNDANTNVSTAIYAMGSAPNVYGWQYSPTQTLFVRAAQIFTGNNYFTQSMGLEIWSNDPSTNLPLARIAGGYWKITQTSIKAWQGTNLDQNVPMFQGTSYWIVFVDPAWSTVPIEGGGTTMPYARFSAGTWTALTASALKFRLFCRLLDEQGIQPKGVPCAGVTGFGTAFANQPPTLGNAAFMIEGSGFQPGAPVVLLFGVNPNWPSIPIPGADPICAVHTDIVLTVPTTAGTGNVRSPIAASGQVVFPLALPANPALVNGILQAQIAAVETGSPWPLPIVTSNALVITLR